jgi:23S rRNA (adenine-N6)-dimethyltransferase
VVRHGPAGRRPPRDPRSRADARRRELGQNLLVDERHCRRIVDRAGVTAGDLVVDLGAGRGALTRVLLERGARVVAIELDPSSVAVLRRDLGGRGQLEVVPGDALLVPLPTEPYRVVANPPFGATTSLLRRLLGGDAPMVDATLLLQAETARRVSGTPASGRFSLTWAPWFELAVHERVPARAFRPVPAADAAVLQIRPRAVPWLSPARFAAWESFLDRVFRASGRTAADRLDAVYGARAAWDVARAAEVDAVRPPSRLPVEAWLALFRAMP